MTNDGSGTMNHSGVLIFACSGAADVGAIADMAARKMARNGAGRMHCLAGIGGRVPTVATSVLSASRIVAIDGCDKNCARETLSGAGFPVSVHLCLVDMGLDKGSTPVTIEVIEQVAGRAAGLLAR